MRFGISATSLICPKNLRTRLRPVNVCCAIVASRCAAQERADLPKCGCRPPPGSIPRPKFELFLKAQETARFRTQKDAQGRKLRPARQKLSLRTAKARNCYVSQRFRGDS